MPAISITERLTLDKLTRAVRRAMATFIFASAGGLAGNSIFNADAATWKVLAGTGLGAVINLIYRWSEAVVKEPAPVDLPGGDVELDKPTNPETPHV